MKTKNKLLLSISLLSFTGLAILSFVNRKKIAQEFKDILNMKFFTIDELCASETAKRNNIDNTPSDEARNNLVLLINNILDPVRSAYGSFISVNSGYRSSALNNFLKGSATSDHLYGRAADITGGSISKNKEIFKKIIENGKYDQLIWEKGGLWIHVSYRTASARGQILAYNGSTYTNITNNWKTALS